MHYNKLIKLVTSSQQTNQGKHINCIDNSTSHSSCYIKSEKG